MKGKVFLFVICGFLSLGMAVTLMLFAIPQSRNYILDKLAPHSNVYQMKEDEVEKLTLENQAKQNTIDLLTQELANKNVELEEKKQRIAELEELLNTANGENSTLKEEKATLQVRVSELEAEIAALNAQLAEYEMYKVEIDSTNEIESIEIEDTKLGTTAQLTNLEITSLELYAWQNVTITYAESENGNVYATLNEEQQETNTITLNGDNCKGGNVTVSSIIVVPEVTSASLFTFSGNTLTGYVGEETDIIIPSSYSLGEKYTVTKEFTSTSELEMYSMETGNYNYKVYADGTDTSYTITSEEDFISYMSDIDMLANEYGTIKIDIEEYSFIDGEDYQVTSIGNYAFTGNENLTSIVLPDTISELSYSIFSNCKSLKSVDLANVTSIEHSLFSGCTSLGNVKFSLVTKIETFTFKNCVNLKNITIPASVTSVDRNAFDGCENLTEINVDSANSSYSSINGILTDKDELTIWLCPTGITGEFTIPTSIRTFTYEAFKYCNKITAFQVETGNTVLSANDGVVFTNSGSALLICPRGKAGEYIVPSGVTSIENNAFYNCDKLTNIVIAESVTNISSYAFYGCSSLTNITIPNQVTELKRNAFYNCSQLNSIVISNSVTQISDNVFNGCKNLINVYFTGSEEEWNAITIGSGNDALTNATKTYNYVAE